MKRISLLGLCLLLAVAASAWNPYPATRHFFQRVLSHKNPSSSQIPQFILDTNHPWLRANEAWLSRYPNISQELCSPDSILWTTPLSTHAPPADLFTNLSIKRNVIGGIYRPSLYVGWSHAYHRLQEMAACKVALMSVRNLHVDLYVDDDKYTIPSPALTELFADDLAQMTNLETLDWGISSEATREFEPAFVAKGLMLPSVKHLLPGAGSDYLVSRCPNLEVIEAGGYYRHRSWHYPSPSRKVHLVALITASTGLEHLKQWHLSMLWDDWTTDMVMAILDATPNITGLHMEGRLKRVASDYDYVSGGTHGIDPYFANANAQTQTLKRYVQLISQFPNLERLSLPASHELDLGFDGGPWCGNAYDGPDGREVDRWVRQDGAETAELAANITLAALPYLKSLTVGIDHGNVTVNDRGQPEVAWPWTGRMEQWAYGD
ncbi:hypothetical protein KVR01_007364 [Diaporthe batatas]|uniref:uncharacterized protein n=1 Tax=Diaporthe batatas TaxID=748121 RepID=UPI001D03FC70|nr:uncharacterized protein KVR01_007364 [Diaporthe batatas]KAG8162886.1 hypothetical protein KVR01_007364 [Diaporthe batatas]